MASLKRPGLSHCDKALRSFDRSITMNEMTWLEFQTKDEDGDDITNNSYTVQKKKDKR